MKSRLLSLVTFLFLLVLIGGCNSDNSLSANEPESILKYGNGTVGLYEISQDEIDGLIHMRLEEKLARDVYIAFGELYNYKVFENISTSEQTHMDAVKRILVKYSIEDPITSDETGIFPDPEFQQLYNQFIVQGNVSLNQALLAGVTIEELDIADLENQLANVVDNPDIIKIYQHLKDGSERHLVAFNKCLSRQPVLLQ